MNTRALSLAGVQALWAAMTVAALAACDGGVAPSAGEPDVPGAIVGELQTMVADYPDGTSERIYYLDRKDQPGEQVHLLFDHEPVLPQTNRLAVWGQREADGLRVTRFEGVVANEDVAPSFESAIIGADPKPRTAAFVLVDLGSGVNTTADSANSKVFTPGSTFAAVYDQMSYGILKFSGDVLGPFSTQMATACDYTGVKNAIKPLITGTYQHYMWYFGSNVSGCAWSGIGAEGSASRPQSDAWYNASTGCTVLVQEVGHNLGWMHSSTLKCTGAAFVDDPTSCTSSEYGNRMTPMGSGCGQLNGHDLWYAGLISGCNAVKVTSSGTFNLMALESPCDGIQVIQIPMNNTTRQAKPQQGNNQPLLNYYLELRGPTGLDTSIKTPAVYVYAGDNIHAATKTSNWSWLLDMNPSTTSSFDGLTVGQSFMDPDGSITITVNSADATKAEIQIDIQGGAGGGPMCMDGSTLSAPGPVDCGAGSGTGSGGAAGGTGGASASGGRSGSGGVTGAGGRGTGGGTGAGGRGGSSAPGTGGVTGTGGAGTGTGGSTTTTGSGGGSTTTGSGGGSVTGAAAPGHGGSGGAPGAISTGGAGPANGSGGASVSGEATPTVTGGCACSTGPGTGWSHAGGAAGAALFGLLALAGRRRQRSRASSGSAHRPGARLGPPSSSAAPTGPRSREPVGNRPVATVDRLAIAEARGLPVPTSPD